VQSSFHLDATFLTPGENLIATTNLVMDPKQLKYTKVDELYSLDRDNKTLTRVNFESKVDPDTVASTYYPQDTSKKAYMV
jgi:hypothetical protein